MALQRLKRERGELGSLALFVDLDDPERGSSLQDVRRRQHVLAQIARGLDESLANTARLHGWRVQELFKAVVVELGGAQLVKDEDEGECFSEDNAMVKLPDYRLVLEDGEMVLAEVKNVAPGLLEAKIGIGELGALERYAELNNSRLLLAHYWTQANLWSLVDASVVIRKRSLAKLKLTDAIQAKLDSYYALAARLSDRGVGHRFLRFEDIVLNQPQLFASIAPELDDARPDFRELRESTKDSSKTLDDYRDYYANERWRGELTGLEASINAEVDWKKFDQVGYQPL